MVGREHGGPLYRQGEKGAQKEEDILSPDFELFRHFYDLSGGIVRLVDIAPEHLTAMRLQRRPASCAPCPSPNTTAGYEQAKQAFDSGVTHATHLFNAMNGLSHRAPGVVGAVFDDSRVRGELICDGFHIHPACAAHRLPGAGRPGPGGQ